MQKILILDDDTANAESLRDMLQSMGHEALIGATEDALPLARKQPFDVLLLGGEAGDELQNLIRKIRGRVDHYIYVLVMSETIVYEQALQAGANNILQKPVNAEALEQSIAVAKLLGDLIKRIGDDREDFPSAGGVIAKSAFNQLFLSAADRANRYGEQTYILFIGVENYREILEMDGPYAADYAVAMLSRHLVQMRRQSDIIGQTAKFEYALLLQRPIYEMEPIEATNRFVSTLASCTDIVSSGSHNVEISVSLVAVPSGRNLARQTFSPDFPKQ